jgi:hypothetical protein
MISVGDTRVFAGSGQISVIGVESIMRFVETPIFTKVIDRLLDASSCGRKESEAVAEALHGKKRGAA